MDNSEKKCDEKAAGRQEMLLQIYIKGRQIHKTNTENRQCLCQ